MDMNDDLQNSFTKKQDFFGFGVTNNAKADYALGEKSNWHISLYFPGALRELILHFLIFASQNLHWNFNCF